MTNATALQTANATVGQAEILHAAVERKGSRFLNDIADSADRMYERPLARAIYFRSQTVDVYVDDVGGWIKTHTPDMVEDHRASDDTARVAAQILEQRELLRRKLEQLTVAPSF